METARDGKTYVLTDLDVQLPNTSQCDQIRAKLDMGAETNILPLRTYKKMFPERLLADGSPDLQHIQPAHLEFECNKESIIKSLGCITLDIGMPGKELIPSQFFISEHHERRHPSCD